MALAFFDYADIENFLNDFNFDGMEPFTMILYHQGDFRELKWDEANLHVRTLSTDEVYLMVFGYTCIPTTGGLIVRCVFKSLYLDKRQIKWELCITTKRITFFYQSAARAFKYHCSLDQCSCKNHKRFFD